MKTKEQIETQLKRANYNHTKTPTNTKHTMLKNITKTLSRVTTSTPLSPRKLLVPYGMIQAIS